MLGSHPVPLDPDDNRRLFVCAVQRRDDRIKARSVPAGSERITSNERSHDEIREHDLSMAMQLLRARVHRFQRSRCVKETVPFVSSNRDDGRSGPR